MYVYIYIHKINVKTAKTDRAQHLCGNSHDPNEGWLKKNNIARDKKFRHLLFLKMRKLKQKNLRNTI